MTVADVIAVVRRQLNDENKQRWPDSVLIGYLSDGQCRVADARPDLLLAASGTMTPVTELSDLDDPLVFGFTAQEGLAAYVCARALWEDSDDQANYQRGITFAAQCNSAFGIRVMGAEK